jgi:hypothetical protein
MLPSLSIFVDRETFEQCKPHLDADTSLQSLSSKRERHTRRVLARLEVDVGGILPFSYWPALSFILFCWESLWCKSLSRGSWASTTHEPCIPCHFSAPWQTAIIAFHNTGVSILPLWYRCFVSRTSSNSVELLFIIRGQVQVHHSMSASDYSSR